MPRFGGRGGTKFNAGGDSEGGRMSEGGGGERGGGGISRW